MKTNLTSSERQYAKVARVFPKNIFSATNARIRVLKTIKGQK
ncbi:hypothetical protein [Gelidibacter maritimus]|nr:hypothetical protein [Gelidibacter maritimus]